MKSVLLIGLGRFGRHMAAKLQELHHEVLAVDKNEERVNDALDLVTHAQIGDSTSEAFIASLGVRNFDLCVVAIGDDFQSSLETTALLKEQGARFVLSRAARDVLSLIHISPPAAGHTAGGWRWESWSGGRCPRSGS